jgi:hypothetical protein
LRIALLEEVLESANKLVQIGGNNGCVSVFIDFVFFTIDNSGVEITKKHFSHFSV